MKRREFLERTGWFVVGATLVGIPGCGDDSKSHPPAPDGGGLEPMGTFSFPQGVASGDPRDTSVVLWTRAIRGTDPGADPGDVKLLVEVATDTGFTTVVADRTVTATAATDHTVRVLVTNLVPGTTYHYRFTAGQDTISGRTITAPGAQSDVQVNFAWVSCQDYGAGNYGAYRQMIIDDDARIMNNADDGIFAVIHLGDMIYETRSSTFQTAIDDSFNPIGLLNADGSQRAVPAFPSGGGTRAGANFANTVDDYRALYKTFLSDPDVQAARARWPFISIWDDHEFTDDCWQSQANYTNGMTYDEPDQIRRVAGSQAWFEYVPVHLTGIDGVTGVAPHAKDFTPPATPVTDVPFVVPNADNFYDEPNNAAAIGAITIYRSLRFGKHVELVLTDERSYRSDHAIPEELAAAAGFLAPRNALPKDLVDVLDLGKDFPGGAPPQIDLGGGHVIDNPRVNTPAGTMLGKAQKQWWKDTMKGSDATWKLWGNEVTLMRLRVTSLGATSPLPADLVISADAWDGYNAERTELMTFLKANAIQNVVVLTGDIHAAFAGQVMDNFEAPPAAQTPVAVEFVGPGISSNSLFSFFYEATTAVPQLNALIAANATPIGGSKFTENFNLLLLHGTLAAGAYAQNLVVIPQTFDPTANPHLRYVDTNSQGYGYIKVGADKVEASIITIQRPIQKPDATNGPGVKRTASFTVASGTPALGADDPVFGDHDTKPFPLT